MTENFEFLIEGAELAVIDDKNADDVIQELTEKMTYKNYHSMNSKTMFLDNWYKFSNLVIFVIDLDLGKSARDGIEIIEKIRQKSDDLPIVVYSAHAVDKDIKNECLEKKANYVVHINGDTKGQAHKINSHIYDYFKKNYQVLNHLNSSTDVLKKIYFDCKVISIENDVVNLRVKDESGDDFDRKFDAKRVDCSSNLQVTKCYKMVDTIHKCGKSSLEFFQMHEDPFQIDDVELKENLAHMLTKMKKSK